MADQAEIETEEIWVAKDRKFAAAAASALAAALLAATPGAAVETIAMVRHGEKPADGLGQISCRGLNRALALPRAIAAAIGKPDAIFAPNPGDRYPDRGKPYNYIRPLATVEPTAISLGMPVDTRFGVHGLPALRKALTQKAYRDATLLVAWEHRQIVDIAKKLLANHGGDAKIVPDWRGDDFDSIYIVTIDKSGRKPTSSFKLAHEGLDGQAAECPGGAPVPAK